MLYMFKYICQKCNENTCIANQVQSLAIRRANGHTDKHEKKFQASFSDKKNVM